MKALGATNNPVIIRRYYIIMFSSMLETITGELCENWVIIILKLLAACNFAQTLSNLKSKPQKRNWNLTLFNPEDWIVSVKHKIQFISLYYSYTACFLCLIPCSANTDMAQKRFQEPRKLNELVSNLSGNHVKLANQITKVSTQMPLIGCKDQKLCAENYKTQWIYLVKI